MLTLGCTCKSSRVERKSTTVDCIAFQAFGMMVFEPNHEDISHFLILFDWKYRCTFSSFFCSFLPSGDLRKFHIENIQIQFVLVFLYIGKCDILRNASRSTRRKMRNRLMPTAATWKKTLFLVFFSVYLRSRLPEPCQNMPAIEYRRFSSQISFSKKVLFPPHHLIWHSLFS